MVWGGFVEVWGVSMVMPSVKWQGNSHIPPPLLQDPWPCKQLLRAELHASETWPLTCSAMIGP